MSAPTGLYSHQTKTPGSYPIGLDLDPDMGRFYEALRSPKTGQYSLENVFWSSERVKVAAKVLAVLDLARTSC